MNDPTVPFEVAEVDGLSHINEMVFSDGLLFIAEHFGLLMIDVSTPSAPVEVGRFATPTIAVDVLVLAEGTRLASSTVGCRWSM